MLATRDAHGLYRQFGFTPSPRPSATWSSGARMCTRPHQVSDVVAGKPNDDLREGAWRQLQREAGWRR